MNNLLTIYIKHSSLFNSEEVVSSKVIETKAYLVGYPSKDRAKTRLLLVWLAMQSPEDSTSQSSFSD